MMQVLDLLYAGSCDETKVDKVVQAHPLQLLKYIKYHYVSLSYSEK